MPRPAVYIETSVVSYCVARTSRDVIVLAHQQVTHEWWNTCLPRCRPFVSQLVVEEASAGDPEAAQRRQEAMKGFAILDITPDAERLAAAYLRAIPVLAGSARDALHVAIASSSGMDYLLTWNCAHIASAPVRRAVAEVNDFESTPTPTICTPEELMEFRL
jgi:hypothetical protein